MYDEILAQKLIDYIEQNQVSTTEIGDCLQKTGAVQKVLPLVNGIFRVGRVHYVYAHSNSNWSLHEQLVNYPENRVLFVDAINVDNRAIFGELVTKYIFNNKKSIAIVVKGLMRDATEIITDRWPVWCEGITPEGCFNMNRGETPEISLIVSKNREYYEDSIAVCDDCGVVIIPKEQVTEEFLEKVIAIEEQEKMWFHCIDDLGWSTYDTVCLKKYKDKKYLAECEQRINNEANL